MMARLDTGERAEAALRGRSSVDPLELYEIFASLSCGR
jgi:hypothetical protein